MCKKEKGKKKRKAKRDLEDAVNSSDDGVASSSSAVDMEKYKKRVFKAVKQKTSGRSLDGASAEPYGLGQSPGMMLVRDDHEEQFSTAQAEIKDQRKAARKAGTSQDPLLSTSKMSKLLAGDDDLIRKPRSFEDDRQRQVLRWTATCLLSMYPKGEEVQCYYQPGMVFIAANTDAVNRALEREFAANSNNVIAVIRKKYEAITADGSRESRHVEKLDERAKASRYPEQDEILKCLQDGRVTVVKAGTNTPGLHAERRIQKHLGGKLEPERLAGVKRPCAICATALELLGHAFSGPMWISKAATQGMDPDTYAQAIADHVDSCDGQVEDVMSHVTETRDGSYTTAHDTDSESDFEEGEDRFEDDDDL